MKRIVFTIILCVVSAFSFAQSQDFLPEGLLSKNANGVTVDKLGNLYVTNFGEDGNIGFVTMKGKYSVYAALPEGAAGNGIHITKKGDLFVADTVGHNIYLINKKKEVSLFAHDPDMTQLSDLVVSSKGYIYVTDPDWEKGTGKLWSVSPEGRVSLLEEDMGTVNGIDLSHDGKKLYVNESLQGKIWVYDVNHDGTLSNKRLFTTFRTPGLDGMTCDKYGNIYVARYGHGTVAIVTSGGAILKELRLKGKYPTDVTMNHASELCFIPLIDRGCFEYIDINTLF